MSEASIRKGRVTYTCQTILGSCLVYLIGLGLFVLLSAWLIRIPNGGPEFSVRREIGNLESGVANFRTSFDVTFIPSRIQLSETCHYPLRDQPGTLDYDSVHYLEKLWPKIDVRAGTAIDWNGDGQAKGDWILEGDECLVFFLGGIPAKAGRGAACMGFSTDPRNPATRGGKRAGPFFEFPSSRLKDLHGRGFFSYLDHYGPGKPYAYFSSYGVTNGYNRYGSTDCPSLGVWPYARALQPKPQYINARGFQIISAGKDGVFGPGTDNPEHVWLPDSPQGVPAEGKDDQANFSRSFLGKPQS